jgi:hypothetical protein
VFDECHNSVGRDLYSVIMQEHFFFGLSFSPESKKLLLKNRPKILGLTASQVKKKISSGAIVEQVRKESKILCNTLYSKLVTFNEDENEEKEIDIQTYDDQKFRSSLKNSKLLNDPVGLIPSVLDFGLEEFPVYEMIEGKLTQVGTIHND